MRSRARDRHATPRFMNLSSRSEFKIFPRGMPEPEVQSRTGIKGTRGSKAEPWPGSRCTSCEFLYPELARVVWWKGREVEAVKEWNGERGEKAEEILGVRDYVNWPGSHSNCGKDAFSRQVGRRRKVSKGKRVRMLARMRMWRNWMFWKIFSSPLWRGKGRGERLHW